MDKKDNNIGKMSESIGTRCGKCETAIIAEDESLAFNAFRAGVFGYLLKSYEKDDVLRVVERYMKKRASQDEKVFIKTFGRFDVFKGNRAIYFSNKKSKELLAMLVDRHGGCVTMEQIIDNLWEERAFDECTKALYRIALKNLRDTLKDEGCVHILKERRGQRSINTDEVICDYFEFLKNPEAMSAEFCGEYMSDYAWGEYTLAHLMEKSKKIF
ncbi:MAG: winged helix-turn-helix domain-containing protein [Clostridia bacterium]|nr:winged helix-turn-helix domain-containing protein [Clostridia bacterium]